MMTTNSYPNAAANMLTSAPWGSWDLLKEEEGKVLLLFLAQLHLSSPSAKYLLRAIVLDWCCQPKQLFNQGNSGQYSHHHHHHHQHHHHHLQGGDMSFALNLVTAAIPPPLLRLQSSLVHHRPTEQANTKVIISNITIITIIIIITCITLWAKSLPPSPSLRAWKWK